MIAGKLACELDYLLTATELSQSPETGDRFHAPNARRKASFAEEFYDPDLSTGPGVNAAGELGRETADLTPPPLFPVLFSEQGHGVVLVHGDVNWNVDERLHLGVFEHLAVDHLLDVGHFFIRNAGEVGEVETQVFRVNPGARLLDVFAEHFSQC